MKKLMISAACAAVATLAACGGDSGSASDSTDPMPLSVGNRWVYDLTYTYGIESQGTSTYEVTGSQSIDGRTAYIVHDDFFQQERDTAYVPDDSSLLRYPSSDATDDEGADGALSILQLPLHAGDTWTSLDKTLDTGFDVDGDGVNEVETVNLHSRVDATESIRTPLGNFDSAYPVISHYQRQIVNPVTQEIYDTAFKAKSEWYVLGVGVVRREVSEEPYGGWRDFHSVELLTAFGVR
jgi:hypothetical protein